MFLQKGFHNSTMDDIANKAGIGKGTLYWHFKTKEELYLSLAIEQKFRIDEIISPDFRPDLSPMQRIQSMLEAIIEHLIRSKELNGLTLNVFGQGPNAFKGDTFKAIQEHLECYRSVLGNIIKDGIKEGTMRDFDPDQFTSVLTSLMFGAMIQSYIHPDSIKSEAFRDSIKLIITNTLKK